MPRSPSARTLNWFPFLTLAVLIGPVVAGLAGTLLPAFGYLPALGGTSLNLGPWRELFELPGFWTSARLSLVTGLAITAGSLGVVAAFCAAWEGTRWFRWTERFLTPLLSVPHVAVAFGIAFLVMPSGWIVRMLSPWATGFHRPPDWMTVQDPQGISLVLGLIAKEVPYLLLMTVAAMGQVDAERSRTVALTLGYGPMTAWFKVVFPRVYPLIRLPVLAVLAYGMSVVDVALVLGPTTPATLPVRLVQLFNDPDLSLRFVASAGGCFQTLLVAAGIALWCGAEWALRHWGTRWIAAGRRCPQDRAARVVAGLVLASSSLAVVLAMLAMALWAFASSWRFPDLWPSGMSLANWKYHLDALGPALENTITIASGATAVAVILSVGVLEQEARSGRRAWAFSGGSLYLPLVLPQVAFLFGAQILLLIMGLGGNQFVLVWMHLVFVFPYVFLCLSDPYRAWDERYQRTAWCLGATPLRTFFRIKAPMLLRPILNAGAIGFLVSVGLYLPTLLLGGGRYPTITTEAVTLTSGGDPRLIGLYALLQMALPFLLFVVVALLVGLRFRHRRGMQSS